MHPILLRLCLTLSYSIVASSCTAPTEPSSPSSPVGARPEPTEAATSRAETKTLEFERVIAAPVEDVWGSMFSPEGYRQWTAPFMDGSYFEGSWAEGERMRFLAPGGSGMLAEIAENTRHEVLSIRHIGFVFEGVEDTTSEGVRSWAPAYETYRFSSVPGGTKVTVEQDVLAGFEGVMASTWPKALEALASLCEAD